VWVSNHTTFASAIPATISFFNDNFLNLDVHALWFDLFYMDWDGNLERIGELRDRYQIRPPSYSNATVQPPLWRVPGRTEFTIKDTLYIESLWSCFTGMLMNTRFYWSLWKGSGKVKIPTTGVAHLRANGQAKLTVSFVCDNILDTWTLTIKGVDCQLRELAVGWVDLVHITNELRLYAINHLLAQPSGHVVAIDDKCSIDEEESWCPSPSTAMRAEEGQQAYLVVG
jgi:hypothetical protein